MPEAKQEQLLELASACAGPGESHVSRAAEQLRLANALQQLGCQHVLHTYWKCSASSRKLGKPLTSCNDRINSGIHPGRIYHSIVMDDVMRICNSAGDARLLDKQCEIAWQMGMWQDAADLVPPDSPGTPAIHATICKLLKVACLLCFRKLNH